MTNENRDDELELDIVHLPVCRNCGGYWGHDDGGWCGSEEMFVRSTQSCPRWLLRDPDVLKRFRPTLWLRVKSLLSLKKYFPSWWKKQ